MLPRVPRVLFPLLGPAVLALTASGCEKVPLLAPTGSTITLTASTNALSANGSASIIGQVLESAGTPPHSGTHVTFVTTIGRVEPADVTTDVNGRVTVTFVAGGSNGTATISALSGGASTGTTGVLKIAVGSAAVGRVALNANPSAVPSNGGSTTITAVVIDINGNVLVGSPVSFTTTAGTLSVGTATTDGNGVASTSLSTLQEATVTATVGAPTSTSTGTGTSTTTTTSGQATATFTVKVLGAPSLTITPPASILRGIPASFTFTVTAASANGSPIREVIVDWGDGTSQSLGAFTGAQAQAHLYTSSGTFLIRATVFDAAGGATTVASTVGVLSPARPSIVVTPSPATQTVGATVTFTVTITAATGVSVRSTSIDYGDGQSEELGGAVSAVRPHIYSTAGTKTVTVYVQDGAGQNSTGNAIVVITP